MTRSSRHKSHKQSKHSTRDYSDSEEDVMKSKEKSSKGDNSSRGHRDIASGEKRKSSSHYREGKESKDLSGHGNGEVKEEHVNPKRRKEKTDDVVGSDRWSGGMDERRESDRNVEKQLHEGESLKSDNKLKEYSNKSENLRIDSKNRSKRDESGISSERKEDSLASVVVSKEGSKSKGESKRKSDRDSSVRKDGKELKEHRSHKEKNGGHESKSGDTEVKLVDMDAAKKQVIQLGDFDEEKQGKRPRENTDRALPDDLQNPYLEKEVEKKIRRKREGSGEREKRYIDSKEDDEKRSSSRGDHAKEVKYRDDQHKEVDYADNKYQENGNKDGRRTDEKYREADKDNKHREDGEKDDKRRGDRHHEDCGRDGGRKDDKYRKDSERDKTRKDGKYWEDIERESRRDDRYYDDGDRDSRRKDGRYNEDGDKDVRRGNERHQEDGDDRRKEISYRDEGNRDNWHNEEKNRKVAERDTRHREGKEGDGHKQEKRARETKYRDDLSSRDRSGDKLDPKYSRDDDYATDHHTRKSSAYNDSPTYDDRPARYHDDQGRRKNYEKQDYGDIKSQSTKDQRSDTGKKSVSSARMDPVADRVRSASRTVDAEQTSSHSRRRSSPISSSHALRDNYRVLKQDDSKHKDYNYNDRVRHNMASSRDGPGAFGVSEKTSSRSLEKLGQKGDDHSRELSSALEPVNRSPASSIDRRQFNRADVRRNIDTEESTQRNGGSRDWREYSGKEGRGSRELGTDVLPGDEFLQADADTSSVSSPFMRNSHFSNSSKSLLPPPSFRTGMDSPSLLGSGEDEGRGKSGIRHRRIGDPNLGRIQGNSWRGIPSWPSPVGNNFLPFAPPVNFHSVMHPFPGPPMFGVRPSMELDHAAPYHMADANRFSGPGRPMGWHHQMDNSGPPMHAWDTNNTVFGDESHIYGRSDWDGSMNLPGGQGREASEDLWRGPNRTASMEMPLSDKENGSTRSGDEPLSGQSIQPTENEKTQAENVVKSPLYGLEDSIDDVKMPMKDDINLSHIYLSKLDISVDLTEPELLTECTGLVDVNETMLSDVDDSKILYTGDEEIETVSDRLLSYTLFASIDDSIFQKSISLYKRQKENTSAKEGEKIQILIDFIPNYDKEDGKIADDETRKMCTKDELQGTDDSLPEVDIKVDSENGLQNKADDTAEISKDPVSGMDSDLAENSDMAQQDHDVEEEPIAVESIETSDTLLPSQVKGATVDSACNNEEVKLLDNKLAPLLNSDVSPGASESTMMPVSVLSESVNLSRIHHSQENTH